MKKFLAAILLSSALILPGCSVFGPVDSGIKVDQTLPEAGQAAQKAINEANILLLSIAEVANQNYKDGIYTKEERIAVGRKLVDYARTVDRAEVLLTLGDFTAAKSQAEAVRLLIIAFHKEVASKARGQ